MQEATFERLIDDVRESLGGTPERPGLLFGSPELERLRLRAAEHPALAEEVMRGAQEIVESGDLSTEPEPYYASLAPLDTLTSALMLEPSEEIAAHTVALLKAVAEAPTWVCHVHGGMRCDHCAANTAAAIARVVDVLGSSLPADVEEIVVQRTWELCVGPFLEVCRDRSVFWAQREHPFNWRIMTCGETGLAAIGLPVPERLAAVEFALEGVADILDRVPEDGDWEEGPGYWAATLFHGLRFAVALRRRTGGRVDLFQHPALVRTAEYFTAVTLADGSVFNYADNQPRINPTPLHLLAGQLRVGHLAWTARRMGHESVWDLLFDDPDVPSEEPDESMMSGVFSTTGIAVSRSGWDEEAVFVGLKSGPTAVGHSHLDLNSFVIQKGKAPLVVDPGIWPYGSALGFFDSAAGGRRWDFDTNATIAHNTILVDGQGQTCGPDYAGSIVASGQDEDLTWFISEASAAYPGLLTRFERWLVHVSPDVVLVYDDLASDRERRWQWLLHPAGTFRSERSSHTIENEGVEMTVIRLLPEPDTPWRNIEEARTTYYQDSDRFTDVEKTIHVQRMGPMLPSETIEFLWAFQLGACAPGEWSVEREDEGTLVAEGRGISVRFEKAHRRCRLQTS